MSAESQTSNPERGWGYDLYLIPASTLKGRLGYRLGSLFLRTVALLWQTNVHRSVLRMSSSSRAARWTDLIVSLLGLRRVGAFLFGYCKISVPVPARIPPQPFESLYLNPRGRETSK